MEYANRQKISHILHDNFDWKYLPNWIVGLIAPMSY